MAMLQNASNKLVVHLLMCPMFFRGYFSDMPQNPYFHQPFLSTMLMHICVIICTWGYFCNMPQTLYYRSIAPAPKAAGTSDDLVYQ